MAGGTFYRKVYTDGYCMNGSFRFLARAGWGVFYGTNAQHNCKHPLDGPVQTSYRAEMKALYHAKAPVCIMCDCKGVVNIFNHHLDGTINMQIERAEQDLWDLIFQAAGTGNSRSIARWMPSHLDESKAEREKNH